MRILYIQPAEGFGGAERQGVLAMKNLPIEGIDVIPLVGPGEPIKQAMKEVGIHDYIFCPDLPAQMEGPGSIVDKLRRNTALVNAWRKTCRVVTETAIERKVDIIFASRAFGWTVAAAVKRSLGIAVVWRAGSRATTQAQRGILRLAGWARPPDALICNCEAVRETIAPLLACSSFIVPNGVDLTHFDPNCAHPFFRKELCLGTRPVIGVSARPAPEKGFELLCEVVEKVTAEVPDVQVLVAGEYPWRRQYESFFAGRGLKKSVRFLGHVEDMQNFYRSCDLVLLTSRKRSIEGSSNALLEAMAMRRPVVTTLVGGIGEAITHSVEGLLSKPDDADSLARNVTSLLNNPGRRERMGIAGREKVSREFSEKVATTRLAQVLRSVVPQTNKTGNYQPIKGEIS